MRDYSGIAARLGRTSWPILCSVFEKTLGFDRSDVVVEVGGGTGGDATLIRKRTRATVVLVDLSHEMLSLSPKGIPKVRADAVKMPFRKGSVDHAYSINLLQDLEDRPSFFREVHGILKPGGGFAMPFTDRSQLRDRFINQFFPTLLSIECSRYPTVDQLFEELRTAGFSEVRRFNADLDPIVVDRDYLSRLESGIWSGLNLIPEREKRAGFERLSAWMEEHEKDEESPVIGRRRTFIVSRRLNGQERSP